MNGRIVRQGHTCSGKPDEAVGAVWQCDCGRYWLKQASGWVITSSIAVGLINFADALAASQAAARKSRALQDRDRS